MNRILSIALAASLALAALSFAADKPALPFSPAVKVRGMICVSGQIGADPVSGQLAGDIRAQTRQAMENIKKVLQENGAGMDNVFKTTVFLANIDDYAAMNEEYVKFFPGVKPARSTVAVAGLVRGALLEIDAMAIDPKADDLRVPLGGSGKK